MPDSQPPAVAPHSEPPANQDQAPSPSGLPGARAGGLGVLVCEDEGLTVLRLRKLLTELGYQVLGDARDGEEAVRLAEQLQPDVILMDVNMPRMDGIEATRRIMALTPTAVVMLTAYSDRGLIEQAIAAGACGYLVKPVRDEQVAPAITVAVSKFLQVQDLGQEVQDLRLSLETRKLVERAKGILMQRRQLTEDEAYRQLQRLSRDRRQELRETARQVISAADLLG